MYNSKVHALGQYAEAAAAIYGAYQASEEDEQQPQAQSSPTGGGAAGPTQPSPDVTAISPTFQQAFTPQISPTIQVTTDSAGARVGATTTQYAGGGQYAAGGGAGVPTGSGAGGMPITPLTPPSFRDDFYYPADAVRDVMATPFNWTPVIYVGGALAAVLLFLQVMKPRRAAAA